jgi:hypothetical protein
MVGVEVIEHVTITGDPKSQVTQTLSTMNRPIWNSHIQTMPDYLAELSSEGIDFAPTGTQFMTISTKVCDTCDDAPTWLPTLKTDADAAPITLTQAAPWTVTPLPQDDTAFLQPVFHAHDHHDESAEAST